MKRTIILVISCCIMSTPVGVFAADQSKQENPAIAKVKNALRQITEAATSWEKSGGCGLWDCLEVEKLVAAGKLAEAPQVPPGIGVSGASPSFNTTEKVMGGCGPRNPGVPRTVNAALENVSEQFCREYNNSVGLGSTVVKNCASGGDCSASGSTDAFDFPVVKSPTFCYLRGDMHYIMWMTPVAGEPCPGK